MRVFSFLKAHLRVVFAVCLLFFIVSGGIFLYLFLTTHQVNIVNQSNSYTVSYSPTEKFTRLMNEWGVWSDKNNLISETEEKVSRVEFIFIDEKQDFIVGTFDNVHVWSTSWSLMGDDTHQIRVYINPQIFSHEEVIDNKNRNIDRVILSAVLETLYQNTHSFTEIRENAKNFTTEFKNDEIPFSIKLTESR